MDELTYTLHMRGGPQDGRTITWQTAPAIFYFLEATAVQLGDDQLDTTYTKYIRNPGDGVEVVYDFLPHGRKIV